MHLIEILLPLSDNEGKPFAAELHAAVRDELAEHFGGVTAFTRSPAEGLWKQGDGEPDRDDIIILEVMSDWLTAAGGAATGPSWSVASARTRSSSGRARSNCSRAPCASKGVIAGQRK